MATSLDSQKLFLGETKETIKCCFLSSHLFQRGKTLERLSFQFSSWTASISSLWYIQEILMWQEWESNLKITGNTGTSTLETFLSGKPGFFTWSPPAALLPIRDTYCDLGIVAPILQKFRSFFLFSSVVMYPLNLTPDCQVPWRRKWYSFWDIAISFSLLTFLSE